jgi:transcription antitermination protein NusB
MGLRREGRELALQMLYAQDTLQGNLRDTLRGFREGVETGERTREFAEALVQGVMDNRQAIDQAILARSKNWALTRMPRVDLNIMRLAAYELMFKRDIPKKVSINEAIEIAKKYGDKESPAFVNGILDELEACAKDEEQGE